MFIVKYRKIFFGVSVFMIFVSFVAMFFWGLNFGIDFKGGSIMEVSYMDGRPNIDDIKSNIEKLSFGNFTMQESGDKGVILRTKHLAEDERVSVVKALTFDGVQKIEEKRFNSVGPTIGEELKRKAWWAIGVVILAIVVFIAFAFRNVSNIDSGGVSSWKYGLATIIALAHDVVIPTGALVYASSLSVNYQIDVTFVMAILSVLGFSVHDTIVVFDRIRENLKLNRNNRNKKDFEEIVGDSLNQTITRSVNTSLTVLFVVMVLFFLGGESTKIFAFVLSIGVIVGTYSSIFLAAPLLVSIQKFQGMREK